MVIGVEIGATKQQLALGDENGRILKLIREEVALTLGAKGILAFLERRIPELLCAQVSAIGVGFGGIVESRTGRVLLSVQVPGWENRKLKQWFEESFSLPTVVCNDTVCGGYGEYCAGSGRGAKTFFYTNIGSGIGGGLFFQGEAYDGQGFGGAYFGNTYIPDFFKGFGETKVEAVCSGWAIERRLRQPGYVPENTKLWALCAGQPERLSCRDLHTAAKEADPFALLELERIGKSIGIGLGNLLTLLHPERISIGGGVSNLGEYLLEPIRNYAKQYAFGPCGENFEILKCQFTEEAVLVGAILLAARNYGGVTN